VFASELPLLADNLVVDDGLSQGAVLAEFSGMLRHAPESFRAFILVEESETPSIIGQIVAWKPSEKPWVWVEQAWVHNEAPKSWKVELFRMVKSWARQLGLSELRCETHRNPETLARRWGWSVHSTVMRLKV
jgi:hypothetical protein